MSNNVEQTDRQEIAATESEFFAKLAKWKAKQAGPKISKFAHGQFGRKPKMERAAFEASIARDKAARKCAQARELSYPSGR
jgi:hypothetical protein